jgi:hypothetical protein
MTKDKRNRKTGYYTDLAPGGLSALYQGSCYHHQAPSIAHHIKYPE